MPKMSQWVLIKNNFWLILYYSISDLCVFAYEYNH